MTLDEYLLRFRLLQHATEKQERNIALLSGGAYRSFLHRFEGSKSPVLQSVLVSEEEMKRSLAKKQRLCERYAVRLTRAIAAIPIQELREYALCYFLYGLTHEEIAEQSYFSVRTVYRYGKKAKRELEKAMRRVKPRLTKIPPCRFRVKGTLPRTGTRADDLSRSVAFCTTRRQSEPYRPIYALR